MKKKIIAVLACMLTMLVLCTMFASAEDAGGEEAIWDFWSLLSLDNLNVGQLVVMLLTTVSTVIKMFSGDGAKSLWELLVNGLKNIIPSK